MPDEPHPQTAFPWVPRRPISVNEYRRMAAARILTKDDAVELVDGTLIDITPASILHSGLLIKLGHVLPRMTDGLAELRRFSRLYLDSYNEPRPDLVLLRRSPERDSTAVISPADIFLLIEFADETLIYDRTVKVALYARHGVPEVWLADLDAEHVEVYRNPASAGYATIERVGPDTALQPQLLPEFRIQASSLLR